jgi:hypothetical protein
MRVKRHIFNSIVITNSLQAIWGHVFDSIGCLLPAKAFIGHNSSVITAALIAMALI